LICVGIGTGVGDGVGVGVGVGVGDGDWAAAGLEQTTRANERTAAAIAGATPILARENRNQPHIKSFPKKEPRSINKSS
jgi:hypothetical protein